MEYRYPVSDIKLVDHILFGEDSSGKNRFVDTMPISLWQNGTQEACRNLFGWFGALPSKVL